jgi:hypothetical protein
VFAGLIHRREDHHFSYRSRRFNLCTVPEATRAMPSISARRINPLLNARVC